MSSKTFSETLEFYSAFQYPDSHMQNAIEAVKKQVPQPPERNSAWNHVNVYKCPSCKTEFGFLRPKHCMNCGQAMDWLGGDNSERT